MDWDLDFQNIVNGNDTAGFSRRGGYDLDKLLRNSIRFVDPGFELGGEHLTRINVSVGQNRVCRRCLEEDLANGAGRTAYRPHCGTGGSSTRSTPVPFMASGFPSSSERRTRGASTIDTKTPSSPTSMATACCERR